MKRCSSKMPRDFRGSNFKRAICHYVTDNDDQVFANKALLTFDVTTTYQVIADNLCFEAKKHSIFYQHI